MKKASYTVNFIDIDLSQSVRASYLERNRITLEAIVQRFSPNALYKVMDDGESLVIVTSDVVDVAGLAKELRVSVCDIDVYDYDKVLTGQLKEKTHTFSIALKTVSKKDGREYAIDTNSLPGWFGVRAFANGFQIVNATYGKEVMYEAHYVLHHVREVTGTLEIVDMEKFEKALLCGIGRGKSLGFGLLLLDGMSI